MPAAQQQTSASLRTASWSAPRPRASLPASWRKSRAASDSIWQATAWRSGTNSAGGIDWPRSSSRPRARAVGPVAATAEPLRPENRLDELRVRPRPVPGEDLVGGPLLRPLSLKIVVAAAAGEARLSLPVASRRGRLHVDTPAL